MKKFEAIINPTNLDEVREALIDLRVKAITATDVRGYAREMGHLEIYRGSRYMDYSTPGIKMEVLVQDWHLEAATEILAKATEAGKLDDGNVLIIAVESALEHVAL